MLLVEQPRGKWVERLAALAARTVGAPRGCRLDRPLAGYAGERLAYLAAFVEGRETVLADDVLEIAQCRGFLLSPQQQNWAG